jgi:hypothetical protein
VDESLMKANNGNIRPHLKFSTTLTPIKLKNMIMKVKNVNNTEEGEDEFDGSGLGIKASYGQGIIEHPVIYSSNQVTRYYPIIHGRGSVSTQTEPTPSSTQAKPLYKKSRKYFDKVYIDMDKLKSNVLFCKYIKNNTNIPRLKTQSINNDTKDVIDDIINERFNIKVYNQLNEHDKRIVANFTKYFKFDLGIDNSSENNEFNKQFQILIGSYYAGNDSPEVKNQLKRYIRKAMSESLISNKEGLNLLYELN